MGRFGSFLLGVVLGGAAVFVGLKYHVVYADNGVHLVPKLYATFDEVYVDIRGFDLADWGEHKALAAALVKADKGELMGEAAVNQARDLVGGVLEDLNVPAP